MRQPAFHPMRSYGSADDDCNGIIDDPSVLTYTDYTKTMMVMGLALPHRPMLALFRVDTASTTMTATMTISPSHHSLMLGNSDILDYGGFAEH